MPNFLFDSYTIDDPAIIRANRDGRIAPEQRAVFGSKSVLLDMAMGSFGQWIKRILIVIAVFIGGIVILGYVPFLKEYEAGFLWLLFATVLLLFVGLTLWHLIRPLRQWRILQNELREDAVATAEGELHFGKRGFHIPVQGGSQRIRYGNVGALKPGIVYRIYYLPRSQVLLSAEAVEPVTKESVAEGLTAILAEANGFALDALPDNRRGKLAPQQYAHLYRKIFWRLLAMAVAGSVIVVWLIKGGIGQVSTLLVVAGLVVLGIVLYFAYGALRDALDLMRKQVLSVEGLGSRKIEYSRSDDTNRKTYYYVIGSRNFPVSARGYNALKEGLRYRAFYTPRGKVLVNIEALED